MGPVAGGGSLPDDQGAEDVFATALWRDALIAAVLIAIDPNGLGGVHVRARSGPVRDLWLEQYRSLRPEKSPFRKIPVNVSDDRLLGGLDLTRTLSEGKPIIETGLLAGSDGGSIIVPMAERMTRSAAAHIASVIDSGAIAVERDGVSMRHRASFATILFDEGIDEHEHPPNILYDRIGFHIDLDSISVHDANIDGAPVEEVKQARDILNDVTIDDDILLSINQAAIALRVVSVRAIIFCVKAAQACAAFAGREKVMPEDAQIAARLVLGPRALPDVVLPPEEQPAPPDKQEPSEGDEQKSEPSEQDKLEDMLVEAVRSAPLTSVFQRSMVPERLRRASSSGGKSGALVNSLQKGRPVGARKGNPGDGGRLDVIATLRTAAPWQKIRPSSGRKRQIRIYPSDIHIKRFKARMESVVIFVVDASGSSAMHRLSEAKGAVEYLLSDCYTRRDHVALIAFRGERAEMLLPPTRSLLRVRRALAQLPGGGGTPLASGIVSAAALASLEKRKGKTPFIVFLSDGRGNIDLQGQADRAQSEEDCLSAARRLREDGCSVLFFDISNRPSPRAQKLSQEMNAAYQPLPFADSASVSRKVKQAVMSR